MKPFIVAFFVLFAATAQAEQREPATAGAPGTIRGRVLDSSDNKLVGATVEIQPGSMRLVTDREGRINTPNLAPGQYKVRFVYVGFKDEERTVTVEPGGQAKVEVKLLPHVSEEVTVTASRYHGEVSALNQKKNADNIVEILPAEVITSLPNANVADAIGRLPSVSLERDEGEGKYVQVRGLEPRYTSATVNGAHIPNTLSFDRNLKFDAIPSNLVGQIELHKTLSPDQEGDAIGGTVNLVTKTAGDQPTFSIGAEGNYVDLQGGRYTYIFDGTYTNRFGPDKALGLVIGGTYDWNGRAINDLEPSPGIGQLADGTTFTNFVGGADERDYRYHRGRGGFAGGLDYRLSNNSSLYLKGLYSLFHNYGERWVTTINPGSFITPTQTDATGSFTGNAQTRTPNEETYSVSAGGKHVVGNGVLLDYNLSYSHARVNEVGYNTAYTQGPSAAFIIDPSTQYFPKFTALGGVNQLDASQYSLTQYQTSDQHTKARDIAVAINVTIPAGSNEFKFGGLYRDEDKTNVQNNHNFSANGNATLLVSQAMADLHDPNYYFGHYLQGPQPELLRGNQFLQPKPGCFRGRCQRRSHP
jgi:TonB-dependent receptor